MDYQSTTKYLNNYFFNYSPSTGRLISKSQALFYFLELKNIKSKNYIEVDVEDCIINLQSDYNEKISPCKMLVPKIDKNTELKYFDCITYYKDHYCFEIGSQKHNIKSEWVEQWFNSSESENKKSIKNNIIKINKLIEKTNINDYLLLLKSIDKLSNNRWINSFTINHCNENKKDLFFTYFGPLTLTKLHMNDNLIITKNNWCSDWYVDTKPHGKIKFQKFIELNAFI